MGHHYTIIGFKIDGCIVVKTSQTVGQHYITWLRFSCLLAGLNVFCAGTHEAGGGGGVLGSWAAHSPFNTCLPLVSGYRLLRGAGMGG